MMNKHSNVYRMVLRRLATIAALAAMLVVSAGVSGQSTAPGAVSKAHAATFRLAANPPSPGPGAPQAGLSPSTNNANKLVRALVAANLAAPLTQLNGNSCTAPVAPGTTRTCDLYAKPGTLLFPGSAPVALPVWGFTLDPSGNGQVPGPILVANAGETLSINLHNNLPTGTSGNATTNANALSLEMPATSGVPDQTGTAVGAMNNYTFGPFKNPGSYILEAGPTPDGARQVRMGLASMVVVRPINFATCNDAYDAAAPAANTCNVPSEYVDETPIVLNEFDEVMNNDPFSFDGIEFSPTRFAINGVAYDPKKPLLSKIDVVPGDVVLVRYANLGDHERGITITNERQLTLADDSHLLTNPVDNATKWLNPGQVSDTFVTIDPSFPQGTQVPIYDAGFHLNNGADTGLGGSFAYFNVAQSVGGSPAGPTVTVNVNPSTNSSIEDATVSGTITLSAGATTLSGAEWWLDNPGVPGTSAALPAFNAWTIGACTPVVVGCYSYTFTIPTATLNAMLGSSWQRDGDHNIWVHAKDNSGGGGTATGPLTSTTLTDANRSWNFNQWVGATATIGSASMTVLSNTGNVLTGTGWLPTAAQYTVTLSEAGTQTSNFAGAGDSVGSGATCINPTDACLVDPSQAWTANQWTGWLLKVGNSTFTVTSNSATVLDGASWTGGAPVVPSAYTLTLNDSVGSTTPSPCAAAGGCLIDPTQNWTGLNWNGAVVNMGGYTLTVTTTSANELDGSGGWVAPAGALTPLPAAPAAYTISMTSTASSADTTSLTDMTGIAYAAGQWVGAVVNMGGNNLTVTSSTPTVLTGTGGWTPISMAYALGGSTWGVATGDVFTYNASGPVVFRVTAHSSPTNGFRYTDVANGGGAIDPLTLVPQNAPNQDLVILGEADSSLTNFVVTAGEYCVDVYPCGNPKTNTACPAAAGCSVPLILTPSGSNATVFDPQGNPAPGTGKIDAYGTLLNIPPACTPAPSPPGVASPATPAAPGGASVVSFCGDVPAAVLQGLSEGSHTLYLRICEQLANGPANAAGCGNQTVSRWGQINTNSEFEFVIDRTGPTATNISLDPNPNNGTLTSQGNLNFLSSLQVATTLTDPLQVGTQTTLAGAGLASGQVYAALPVAATARFIPDGSNISIGYGSGTNQTVTTSDDTAAGALSIPVKPFAANAAYASGTAVAELVNSPVQTAEVFVTCSPVTQPTTCKSIDATTGPIDPVTNTVMLTGSGAEMIPSGGAWDSANKLAYAYIPLAIMTEFPEGHVRFWAHAQDKAGNWGAWNVTDLIYDKTPPVFDSPAIGTVVACQTGCDIAFTAHDPVSNGVSSNIVHAEWFIDQGVHLVCEVGEIVPGCTIEVAVSADPGYGNGTPIPLTVGNPITGHLIIPAAGLPAGTNIVFRVRDAAGNWSKDNLVITS